MSQTLKPTKHERYTRVKDWDKYRDNLEAALGGPKLPPGKHTFVYGGGKLSPVERAGLARSRRRTRVVSRT